MNISISTKKQSGQAILLVIVAIAAVLVVSLSLVSRSITDVRTTTSQEESVRAFSAAESGVERALLSGSVGTIASTPDELDNAVFTASVTNFAQNQTEFIHPKRPLSGDDVTTWLMSHDPVTGELVCNGGLPCFNGTTLTVCWAAGTITGPIPAIEVSVFYDPTGPYDSSSYGDVAAARITYDPDAGRRATNNFLAPTSGGNCPSGVNFAYQTTINLTAPFPTGLGINNATSDGALKFVKIRPLYNPGNAYPIGISTNGVELPGQGKLVESTGVSGDSTRKIEVFTLYSEPPFVFDSTVYSTGGITK